MKEPGNPIGPFDSKTLTIIFTRITELALTKIDDKKGFSLWGHKGTSKKLCSLDV